MTAPLSLTIRPVELEQLPIWEWVTGKFLMQVMEDSDQNKVLAIAVELVPSMEGDEEKRTAIAAALYYHLRRLNSEFANYVPDVYPTPPVTLHSMGNLDYFPVGVKHRYTRSFN